MAETFIEYPFMIGPGKGDAVAYSTTGKKHPRSKYAEVIQKYRTTGDIEEGFTVLPMGSAKQKMRSGFETLMQPAQRAMQKVGGEVATGKTPQMVVSDLLKQSVGLQTAPGLIGERGRPIGEAAGRIVGEQVSTPERAAATGAIAAASALTGGMSALPAALVRMGITGGAVFGAQELTGGAQGRDAIERFVSKPMIAAGLVGLGEGFTGVFRMLTRSGLSRRAVNQIGEDVMELIETVYPHLRNAGASAINRIAQTPKGLKELTQIGVRALRTETNDVAFSMYNAILRALPSTPGKVVQRKLAKLVGDYGDEVYRYMDNIGDEKIIEASRKSLESMRDDIGKLLSDSFKDTDVSSSLARVFQNQSAKNRELIPGAELLYSLRKSGAAKGFDAVKFQNEVFDKYATKGPLYQYAARAAGRGELGGRDITKKLSIPFPTLRTLLTGKVSRLPFGSYTRYSGRVRDVPSAVGPDIAGVRTLESIDRFLSED